MDYLTGFLIAAALLTIGVVLFVAAFKRWISDRALMLAAYVGGIVAALASLVVVVLTIHSMIEEKSKVEVVFLPVGALPELQIEIDGEPIDSLSTQLAKGSHEVHYSYGIGDSIHESTDQVTVESDTTIRLEPRVRLCALAFEPSREFSGLQIEIDGKLITSYTTQVPQGFHRIRYFYSSGSGVLHERTAEVMVDSDTIIRVLHFR
ncbi:MAG: hypothetical protein ABIJ61_06750 [bacterium]